MAISPLAVSDNDQTVPVLKIAPRITDNAWKTGCDEGSGVIFRSIADIAKAMLGKYRDNNQKHNQPN